MLPPTTPEQRAPLYEDLEDLITIGFLSHPIGVHGVQLALRTLGPGDIFVLRSVSSEMMEHEWQTWIIASSIWMVNGYNLLGESNALYHMYQMLRNIPRVIHSVLYSQVMGLFARQNKALLAIEPYCYESISRFKWKARSNHHMSGVPGAHTLGTNHALQMWNFFNDVEDKRIADETQWDGFKLAASASSPKGIQKIDKHDQNRREQETNRRKDVMDRFYYTQKGYILPGDDPASVRNSYVIRSKSVEELEAEMQRWVEGKQDEHDRVVSQYKQSITDRYEAEQKAREERRKMLQQKYLEMELDQKSQPLVGYTVDQMDQMLAGRTPGVKTLHDDTSGLQNRLYHQHLHLADKGLLAVENGKIIAPAADPSLMDLISDRPVPFKVEE